MVLSLVTGWISSRFNLSRWVEPMVFTTNTFFGTVAVGIMIIGFLFNIIG
jgi:hypothetical protein